MGEADGFAITVHQGADQRLLAEVMDVMVRAFDPLFGEAWTASQTAGMLTLPGARLIAGHADDRLAGFGLIRAIAGESELLLLAVAPECRGRGVGRAILDECIAAARVLDARIMFLEVRDGNSAADLYRAARFEHYNSRRDYYLGADGNRRSALSFRLILI